MTNQSLEDARYDLFEAYNESRRLGPFDPVAEAESAAVRPRPLLPFGMAVTRLEAAASAHAEVRLQGAQLAADMAVAATVRNGELEARIEALTTALRACETALVLGKTPADDICASCGINMRQSAGHHTGACKGDITGSGRVSKALEQARAALADPPQRAVDDQCETCEHDKANHLAMLPAEVTVGNHNPPNHCTDCCVEGLDELPEGWEDKPHCQHAFLGLPTDPPQQEVE